MISEARQWKLRKPDPKSENASASLHAENGKLPLSYDAVVSAVSQPVTEQDVLSVVFVLEWKGE